MAKRKASRVNIVALKALEGLTTKQIKSLLKQKQLAEQAAARKAEREAAKQLREKNAAAIAEQKAKAKALRKELKAVEKQIAKLSGRKVVRKAKGKGGRASGTRDAVVAALGKGSMTAGEIAKAIGYTGANINSTLNTIAKSGAIKVDKKKRPAVFSVS